MNKMLIAGGHGCVFFALQTHYACKRLLFEYSVLTWKGIYTQDAPADICQVFFVVWIIIKEDR